MILITFIHEGLDWMIVRAINFHEPLPMSESRYRMQEGRTIEQFAGGRITYELDNSAGLRLISISQPTDRILNAWFTKGDQ